jgi:hypothetical protein
MIHQSNDIIKKKISSNEQKAPNSFLQEIGALCFCLVAKKIIFVSF